MKQEKNIEDLLLKPEQFPIEITGESSSMPGSINVNLPPRHKKTQDEGINLDISEQVIINSLELTYNDLRNILKKAEKDYELKKFCDKYITLFDIKIKEDGDVTYKDNFYDRNQDPELIKKWLGMWSSDKKESLINDFCRPNQIKIKWFPINGYFQATKGAAGIYIGLGRGGPSTLYMDSCQGIIVKPHQKKLFTDKIIKEYEIEISLNEVGLLYSPAGWKTNNATFMARLFGRNWTIEYNNEFVRRLYQK